MTGTLGDFLVFVGEQVPASCARLADAAHWPSLPLRDSRVHVASPGPGLQVWWRGDARVEPTAIGGLALGLDPAAGQPREAARDPAERLLGAWCNAADFDPLAASGRFAGVVWDARRGVVAASTDAFRTCSVFWASTPAGLLVASDLRLILRSGLLTVRPSLAALYQYLNFSYVPAPLTAVEGVHKLPAGHRIDFARGGQPRLSAYWDVHYPADFEAPESDRVAELRRRIIETIEDYRWAEPQGWGAFLSGGTDSSSICSVLSRAHSHPVKSFSIGFAEAGYDELSYAQIASRSFGLDAHEYRVNERDTVDAIARLAQAFDEPFGNASAVPTFYCAQMAARAGVDRLVAGDGGDEIFGGNERYRKDAIFERFHQAPPLLQAAGRAVARALDGFDSRWANRVKNFVHRGSLPNPDRFYSDDSFASDHFDELLSASFRSAVGRSDALDVQRRLYAHAGAQDSLHKLMYLDLKMTIADNDIVKVVRASRSAGVDVAFPYLDRRLVEFTGRLPASDKLRGSSKRHLFKRATHDILPAAIRQKKKQGFGLPISVWLRQRGEYRQLVGDVVLSARSTARGYFEPGFVRQLIERHERGAWDHSPEVHMLLMLELWHRQHIDGHD